MVADNPRCTHARIRAWGYLGNSATFRNRNREADSLQQRRAATNPRQWEGDDDG